MKSRKLSAAVVAALAVMALSVFGPGGYGSGVSEAKGPNKVSWDAKINDGAVVAGGVGTSVGTSITFGLDAGNPAPSDVAFFDSSRTQTKGLASSRAPASSGRPSRRLTSARSPARSPSASRRTRCWRSAARATSRPAGAYTGYVPNCGDNSLTVTTRDYTGSKPRFERAGSRQQDVQDVRRQHDPRSIGPAPDGPVLDLDPGVRRQPSTARRQWPAT